MLADLQLAAVHAQDAAVRLLGAETQLPKLTERELQVLHWSMNGKTASETGQILGIAASTVNYFVGRALVKLECENKHHAVLKAISLGLI